jgi:hypothetical protein
MSLVKIQGNASGTGEFTIAAPNSNTNRTLTLPDNTGTILTAASTPAFASTIGVGGATAAASGAGITFPATQSASSDANTLDDYEEGTWTPAFNGSGAITYTSQTGTYTKIGRQVTCVFFLQVNTSSRTGVGGITGLPFTGGNTNYAGVSLSAYETGSYSGQCNVLGLVANTTTEIQLRITSSATQAPTTSTIANLAAGTIIAGSLTYFTS